MSTVPFYEHAKFHFSEVVPLFAFTARFKDAVARKDEAAAKDLLVNFRVGERYAYRISSDVFFHGSNDSRSEAP